MCNLSSTHRHNRPAKLYHATEERNVDSILRDGFKHETWLADVTSCCHSPAKSHFQLIYSREMADPKAMSNFNAIYLRQIGDRWYTLLGVTGEEYSDDYYSRQAMPSDTREEAFANARALAEQQSIPPSMIFDEP